MRIERIVMGKHEVFGEEEIRALGVPTLTTFLDDSSVYEIEVSRVGSGRVPERYRKLDVLSIESHGSIGILVDSIGGNAL